MAPRSIAPPLGRRFPALLPLSKLITMSQPTPPRVIDATRESFQTDVLERSHDLPVVVDFWASWCGPCRMLGPLLERLADEYGGQFLLVKADTDQLGDIAAAFGVQGIPAVFALKNGEIVDQFVGVQPERVIREWIDRLLPGPSEKLANEAKTLETTDPARAEAKYREALALDAELARARIGLARVLLAAGKTDAARNEIAYLERRGYLEPEAEQLKAEIVLKTQGKESGGLDAARAEVAARPDDLNARFHLAEALAAAGQYAEALQIALDLVERDRKGLGEQARQTMLAIFNLLPPDDPLAVEYRRKLSFVL